jgi:hypothetical protein
MRARRKQLDGLEAVRRDFKHVIAREPLVPKEPRRHAELSLKHENPIVPAGSVFDFV